MRSDFRFAIGFLPPALKIKISGGARKKIYFFRAARQALSRICGLPRGESVN
jgi:hypothetical protein